MGAALMGVALMAGACDRPEDPEDKPADDGGSGDLGGVGGAGGDGGADGGGDGAADGGGDGGADEGSDVGSDVGSDGGTDVGSDGGAPEVGPEDVPCGGELSFQARFADRGGACTTCDGAEVWLAAIVYNPCEEPLPLEIEDGVLVRSLSLINLDTGEGMGSSGGGGGPSTSLELDPGAAAVELQGLGALGPGTWEAELSFSTVPEGRATATARVD